MAKCGAKTKRNKGTCAKDGMKNGRCYWHGGATPSGIASANFKHGKYSKELPDRLIADYQKSINDPDVLALTSEISLTDTRIMDLLTRVDTGESGSLWKHAHSVFMDFRSANASADQDKMTVALTELNRVLNLGVEDYRAWDEVGKLLEQRRKLVESERKRRTDMDAMITAERQMLLIAGILGVIKENVTNRETLSALTFGIRALIPDIAQ